MEPDLKRKLDSIDKKIDKLTTKIEELSENSGIDTLTSDQVTGTSRKLDEILRLLKNE